MSKIAFITGASSGIGAACARKFAQGGYTLLLNARSEDKLQTLKTELETTYGTDIMLLPFDTRISPCPRLPRTKRAQAHLQTLTSTWTFTIFTVRGASAQPIRCSILQR